MLQSRKSRSQTFETFAWLSQTRYAPLLALPYLRGHRQRGHANMSLRGSHWPGGGSCSLPLSGIIIVRSPVALMWRHKDQPPAGTLVVILLMVCVRALSPSNIWDHLVPCISSIRMVLSGASLLLQMYIWCTLTTSVCVDYKDICMCQQWFKHFLN